MTPVESARRVASTMIRHHSSASWTAPPPGAMDSRLAIAAAAEAPADYYDPFGNALARQAQISSGWVSNPASAVRRGNDRPHQTEEHS